MRVRPAFLAVALPALALALAACSGGAPRPEAPSVSDAASTPAPTTIATPEAAPSPEATPTPTPEQACANGVAVADPEANPGLAADCEALLSSMDALRGDASLDWGGGLAIADWEGVTVFGEPPRVRGLDLRGKGLTGSIPHALRRLRLDEALFGGNALTGCVPSAFEDVWAHDVARLGLPWCLRYDRLDAAGEAAEAGSWAILNSGGEVLTTWEGLRSGAIALRVHQTDAGGSSWTSEFGAVATGGLFEWREASDCWVRYRVTGAPVAPSGASGRWEFPIEWYAYAATGAGCTGVVGAGAVLRADEAAPTVVSTAEIASPVRQGPFLIAPEGWDGAIESETPHPKPGVGPSGASGPTRGGIATDPAAARRIFAYWRDPVLPTGWRLSRAIQDPSGHSGPPDGYCARYLTVEGYNGVTICIWYMEYRPHYEPVWRSDGSEVYDLRTVDGHTAFVAYSPLGPRHDRLQRVLVRVFDGRSGLLYEVEGHDGSLRGNNADAVIAIARSLLPPPAP